MHAAPSAPTRSFTINDTTLRDGEQTAGVAFTEAEKLAIGLALEAAGVPEMEIGIPSMGPQEVDRIRSLVAGLKRTRTMVWARMAAMDVAAALRCGADIVHVSVPTSDLQLARKLGRDRAWALQQISRWVATVREAGSAVSVGFEDASRADDGFLAQAAQAAQAAGACRVRYADTLGLLDPFATHAHIAALRAACDLEIEIHAHDDLGLATANTLAAFRAGATHASTTVNGLGERAGNAAMEEVVMGLRHLHGLECGVRTEALPAISRLVAQASGRPVAPGKSIVGEAVFSHESGIHVDGLLKDRHNYEAFAPEELGRSHRLVLGKHSGSAAVLDRYAQLGLALEPEHVPVLLEHIRSHAVQFKHEPSGDDLLRFFLAACAEPRATRHLPALPMGHAC